MTNTETNRNLMFLRSISMSGLKDELAEGEEYQQQIIQVLIEKEGFPASPVVTLAPGLIHSPASNTLYIEKTNQWLSCNDKTPVETLLARVLELQLEVRLMKQAAFDFKYRESWKAHLKAFNEKTRA